HGTIRLFFLRIQLLHNFARVMTTRFSLTSYSLNTVVAMTLLGTHRKEACSHDWPLRDKVTHVFAVFIGYVYVAFLILQSILAFGNCFKWSKKTY
ncbi:uncharacterized protein M421DRAFT_29793, partial [Didymella exigua CBS 183.55]